MLALITGGTGYVATHLTLRLLDAGLQVRLTRRTPSAMVNRTLAARSSDVDWVNVPDVGPDTDWREALHGVNVVFHLAGVAHRLSASQAALEAEYDRVNALGTRRLANSLRERGGAARLVLLSSVGAVSSTSESIVGASTLPRPDTPYGRSKLLAERLLAEACAGSAVEWCVVRAPLVYGPGAPGNMQRLLRLAGRIPLPLARARARRSFIFVGNLVDALLVCARHPGVVGHTLLVADDETTSVAQLLELVCEIRGTRAMLFPFPLSLLNRAARIIDVLKGGPADRNDRLARSLDLLFGSLELDISEFRAATQWRAPYSLREGMLRTLADALMWPR